MSNKLEPFPAVQPQIESIGYKDPLAQAMTGKLADSTTIRSEAAFNAQEQSRSTAEEQAEVQAQEAKALDMDKSQAVGGVSISGAEVAGSKIAEAPADIHPMIVEQDKRVKA